MKRGILLVATFSICSALYAQGTLTREEAREVFAAYNPALLQKAAQDEQLNQLLDQLLRQFTSQHPADTLENRHTLIALARNFENSYERSIFALIPQGIAFQFTFDERVCG